jgi:hypothetical protein
MLRVGFDQGKLLLTADFLARDTLHGLLPLPHGRMFSKSEQRFEPVEDLVASLDSHAAAAVTV